MWLKGEGGLQHQLLDVNATLKENLTDRTITEFPVLHVLTKGTGTLRNDNSEKSNMEGTSA